tara:strand:- start:2127 stop:2855 length:729 start_codon:yes stop_codon:yes gene_type:complete
MIKNDYRYITSFIPSRINFLIEFIGGTYLGLKPSVTYRRLFEALYNKGFGINAFAYIPQLDHQYQSNKAWMEFRKARYKLESIKEKSLPVIRLGHSLGCKLHLLAPDGGRNCEGTVSISFNNFTASKSIPMLNKMSPKFGFKSEFSPSPKETLRRISEDYLQANNLVISFSKDKLDESKRLIYSLNNRNYDKTKVITLDGDHLSPASAGFRKVLFGDWADDSIKLETLSEIAESIIIWCKTI